MLCISRKGRHRSWGLPRHACCRQVGWRQRPATNAQQIAVCIPPHVQALDWLTSVGNTSHYMRVADILAESAVVACICKDWHACRPPALHRQVARKLQFDKWHRLSQYVMERWKVDGIWRSHEKRCGHSTLC